MNPKAAKSADPFHIFLTAEAFDRACQVLADHMPDERRRSVVFGTNAALTLELYLKCLCVLEHGTYPEGHDLEELFRLLSRQTKKRIEAKWKKEAPKTEWYKELRRQGVDDLPTMFKLGKDSFVKFRYAFEPESQGTFWALGSVIFLVKSFILFLHPEWKEREPLP